MVPILHIYIQICISAIRPAVTVSVLVADMPSEDSCRLTADLTLLLFPWKFAPHVHAFLVTPMWLFRFGMLRQE